MATIDTSTIEGFDTLTAEQKLEAVLKMDIPEKVDMTQFVPKATADKYSSEVAEQKRKNAELQKQLQGKMTDDEAAEAERQAQWDKLVATNKAQAERIQKLELASTEASYKAKYLAMPGFDEKLAEETAKAMAAGQMDKVFENQQKANEAYKKQVQAELVKGDPKPGGAGGDGGEPDNVKWARERAKQRNEAMKAGNDNMKKFML